MVRESIKIQRKVIANMTEKADAAERESKRQINASVTSENRAGGGRVSLGGCNSCKYSIVKNDLLIDS